MTTRLLLDEMFSAVIAAQLREKGHEVTAMQGDPTAMGLPDPMALVRASADNRALVSRNIKDFIAIDAQTRAAGNQHAGLILVSTKTFPEDRGAIPALIRSLDRLLTATTVRAGEIAFLQRV